jgi:uncharacterized phage protein gp47/JayE
VDEILKKLLDAISDVYEKSRGYIIYDLLMAVAKVMEDYDLQLKEVQDLLDVDKLSGEMLERYIFQRKGIERTKATHAVGYLEVKGYGTIHEGDLFETKSGVQFRATETKIINGTGTVHIEAVKPGSSGNVPANQITQMPITISGITGVNNPEPTFGGYEAESDESLRERYYLAIREPITSGNVYHYVKWSKEVSGVGGVKVFPLERGENTVEVVIIDQNKQPANENLVQAVQEYIDPNSEGIGNGQAPIGAKCYVVSATGVPINVSVSIIKDTAYTDEQIKTIIENSLREYLRSIASIAFNQNSTSSNQNYVSYAAIGNLIFEAEGVQDYHDLLVNGSNSNVLLGDKEVAIMGDVTIA